MTKKPHAWHDPSNPVTSAAVAKLSRLSERDAKLAEHNTRLAWILRPPYVVWYPMAIAILIVGALWHNLPWSWPVLAAPLLVYASVIELVIQFNNWRITTQTKKIRRGDFGFGIIFDSDPMWLYLVEAVRKKGLELTELLAHEPSNRLIAPYIGTYAEETASIQARLLGTTGVTAAGTALLLCARQAADQIFRAFPRS